MRQKPQPAAQKIFLKSSSINQKILQACQPIIRIFFSHFCFDNKAGTGIWIETCHGEKDTFSPPISSEGTDYPAFGNDYPISGNKAPRPKALVAHWVCAGEMTPYIMEGKELERLWHLVLESQRIDKDSPLQIAAKQTVLQLLQKVTGQRIPWGILTGVRPGRLWHELEETPLTLAERREILSKQYLVDNTKIDLLQSVAIVEKKILRKWNSRQNIAVYISIPFCPSRCSYCTFPGYGAQKTQMEAYLKTLKMEISLLGQDIAMFGFKINTIYMGGGTPTTLEAKHLMDLLGHIISSLPLEKGVEFCCEAGRPDTITEEKLAILAEAGINRLCINPQTLNDTTLQRIKRSHSAEDFVRAYELARHWDSWHINADMILGLPGENETHVMRTTEELVQLALDSITVHYLSLKRGSEMWVNSCESAYENTGNPANTANTLWLDRKHLAYIGDCVQHKLRDLDYQPYYMYRQKGMLGDLENIGYSRQGAQSLYNTAMIAESQHIAGLGAGAASKILLGKGSHKNIFHAKDITVYGGNYSEKSRIRTQLWEKEKVFL